MDGRSVPLGGPRQRAVLAVLLLHANELVPADRLVEESWCGRSPPGAAKTLQSYVSRLRRLLSGTGAVITSRGDGYELRVDADELDVACFGRLAARGREALAGGDPHRARQFLDQALSLWRGDPLADLAYEDVAPDALRHLSDVRLAAEADRVEADLRLGRADAAVVAQIECLLEHRPHDERLREQLMLALYRSGRQAEALAAYRDTRALLVDGYGIEPSTRLRDLERKILRQDPTLDAAPVPAFERGSPVGKPWRRRRLAAGSFAAAAAVVVAVLAVGLHHGSTRAWGGSGEQAALLDASSGGFEGGIALGNAPSAIAQAHRLTWVTSGSAGTVDRVDIHRGQLTRIAVAGTPAGIAVTPGLVWVADSSGRDVARISMRREQVIDHLDVCNGPLGMAAGLGSVWVACPLDGTLVRIDPRSERVLRRIPVGASPTGVAVAAGDVWVTLESTGTVARYDPGTHAVTPIPVGSGPSAITAGEGSVWVANTLDHTVTRLDAASGRVESVTPVGSDPQSLAAVPGGVWVAEPGTRRLTLLGGKPASVTRVISTQGGVTAISARGATLAAAAATPVSRHRGGTIRYTTNELLTRPDPALTYSFDGWQLLSITNDGLLTYHRTGGPLGETVVPDLANALPREADGGRVWTFDLRPGIRYSTGRPVRAADFRFALERDFESGSPAAPLYADIKGARPCRPSVPCDLQAGIRTRGHTVTFRLTRSDADFPLKLALPFADAVPVGWAPPPAHPRGVAGVVPATGPYRISGYTADRVVLTRNRRYREWSVDAQPPGLPARIVADVVPTERGVTRLITRHAVDVAGVFSGRLIHRLRAHHPDEIVVSPTAGVSWEAVNTRRAPFSDVRVRRALAYAVDRGRAAAHDFVGSTPSCQILPPDFPGYVPSCRYTIAPGRTWQHPDLLLARHLVRDAHAVGSVAELVAVRGFANDIGVLRRALTAIGLRVRVVEVSLAEDDRLVGVSPARFSLTSYGWQADYPAPSDFFDELFTCKSFVPRSPENRNLPEFCSPRIDRMIRRADRVQVAHPTRAYRLWAAVDRAVTWQAPVIPLYSSGVPYWVSPRTSGFAYNPFIGVLLDQLWVHR